MIWLWSLASASASCEFVAEGAPTAAFDCAKAERWAVRCKLPQAKGKRRVRLQVPEWDLEAETRLPLTTGSRFEVSLLGPEGARGDFAVESGKGPLADQVVSAMQLCRPGEPPATLQITVTEHQPAGYADEIDANGVINRVSTYDAGRVVATAAATLKPPSGEAAAPTPEPVRGELKIRKDEGWATLTWTGRKQRVLTESGGVTLLRLDFSRAAVVEALGPGDATALLAEDLVRWLSGSYESRLGLVAFRKSGVAVPVAEVPTFAAAPDAPRGWRGARAGTSAFSVGPLDAETVRVALAFRPAPLDDVAYAALNPLWTAPLAD